MITGEEFLDLARIRLAPVFREFGFREIGAGVETTYAELKTNHQTRSLKIGMDRAQDYRVYAKIRRLGPDGRPIPDWITPREEEDFNVFDLEFVVAQGGRPHDGLGEYGAGSMDEVAAESSGTRRLEPTRVTVAAGPIMGRS